MREEIKFIMVLVLVCLFGVLINDSVKFSNYTYDLKTITQGYSLSQMKDAVATCEKDLPRSQHCVIVVSAQPVKEK